MIKLSEFIPISGVYTITNDVTGKIYVGQSYNIHLRWHTHLATIITGTHTNATLMQDVIKYGADNFSLQIIEVCEPDKVTLLALEAVHLHALRGKGNILYNATPERKPFYKI